MMLSQLPRSVRTLLLGAQLSTATLATATTVANPDSKQATIPNLSLDKSFFPDQRAVVTSVLTPDSKKVASSNNSAQQKSPIRLAATLLASAMMLAGYIVHMVKGIPVDKRTNPIVRSLAKIFAIKEFGALEQSTFRMLFVNNLCLSGFGILQAFQQQTHNIAPHIISVVTVGCAYIARKLANLYGTTKESAVIKACKHVATAGLVLFGYCMLSRQGYLPEIKFGYVDGELIGAASSSLVRAAAITPLALAFLRAGNEASQGGVVNFPSLKGQTLCTLATLFNLFALSLPAKTDWLIPVSGAAVNLGVLAAGYFAARKIKAKT